MKRISYRPFFLAVAAWLLATAVPAAAQPVDSGHVVSELVAQTASAPPGGTVYVALRQKIDRGWHTYWRNPGDAGEPTRIRWTLPAGWRAAPDFVWATPRRLPLKPLMDYGYTGEVLLPVAITVPSTAKPGEAAVLRAAVAFLVCEELCVPEDALLSIKVKVAAGKPGPDLKWGRAVDRALAEAPKRAGLKATFARQGAALKIAVTGAAVRGGDFPGAYFFPYASTVIAHAQPQRIERGPGGLTLTLSPGYDFTKGKPPEVIAGVLDLGGAAYEINARAGALPAGARGAGPVSAAKPGGGGGGVGLPAAVALAFLGGLILNLMPCVFPVLSMKAAALAAHAHDGPAARAHGLAFLGGVVATFLGLASLLIAAQAAGAAVGWGFQLQSPAVVAGLSLLMLLLALNLSGVFEVGGALQGAAGRAQGPAGLAGSALTGALAVIVAAPCTAPFMAAALGFALTQPPALALLVFTGLGLGFGAPFAVLAFAPPLLRRLPSPGPWMDSLRRLLAFPLYGTAAWLAWVLALLAGDSALAALLAAGVFLALAAWLYGRAQTARSRGNRSLAFAAPAAIAGGAAVALLGFGLSASTPAGDPVASASAAVPFETFTPARLGELRAAGTPVLVNFTAAWCVTCQVNDRLALSTRAVADALARTGAVYMKADWTRRDPVIADALAEHGRAGVPLYLVYGSDGREAVILPQLLTEGEVVGALEEAARSS